MSEININNSPNGANPDFAIVREAEDIVHAAAVRVRKNQFEADLAYADRVIHEASRPVRREQWRNFIAEKAMYMGVIACGIVAAALLEGNQK